VIFGQPPTVGKARRCLFKEQMIYNSPRRELHVNSRKSGVRLVAPTTEN
jgi:hypothetical protein